MRQAEISRNTLETRITVRLNLDGSGQCRFATGVPFLDHMLDQVARHGMIDLDVEAQGDLHIDAHHTVEDTAICFGEALRQVLLNLLRNAFDAVAGAATPGRVWITLALRRHGLATGDAVALSVRDNGPGFTPQALANLFVPFHTTKSGGTGLGLPISQRIVENHRGLIEASSPEGGGAQFTVLLPLEPLPRAAAPA